MTRGRFLCHIDIGTVVVISMDIHTDIDYTCRCSDLLYAIIPVTDYR